MRCIVGIFLGALLLGGGAQAQYYWCQDGDQISVSVVGSSVTIFHDAVLYNCCPNPIEYSVGWENGQQVIVEDEILINGCWCQCCYNLSATFEDFAPGDHNVVYRWFDEEPHDWVEVELAFTVPNEDQPGQEPNPDKVQVGDFWQSECLAAAASVPDEPEPTGLTWDAIKAIYHK